MHFFKKKTPEAEAASADADSMDLDADAPRPSKVSARPPTTASSPGACRVAGRRSPAHAYQARKVELKEEIRQNKVAQRKAREDREKRKKENVLCTGTKLQRVTNPKTIQKIAKSKNRKQLKVVPNKVLGGKKSEASRRMQVPGLEN
jgi:hypothetical protein